MGRPRGSNYEKNLKKRQAYEQKLVQKSSLNAGEHREQLVKTISNEKLIEVVKGLVPIDVNKFNEYGGRKPVYHDDEMQMINDGVMLRAPNRIPYDDLRAASWSNSLIGAIHKIRVDDLTRFGEIVVSTSNKNKEGFSFELEDEEADPSEQEKALIKDACKFFKFMGDKIEGWSRRDKLKTVFEMMIRDTLSIDGVAFYLVRNALGRLIEIKYLDPGTIFPVDPTKGYRGDKRIGYVQIVNNNIREIFAHEEIVWKHQNHISDVRMRSHGFSPTEACAVELVGVINALKFNRDRFNSRNPPQGILSLDGDVSEEAMESLQMQWANMFAGNQNNWRIPIIATPGGDVKYINLNTINDMTFDKLLQWLSSLVLAAHGMDQAELGMKLQASGQLSEASPDARIAHSMTRSKKAMLSFFSDVFNELKEHQPAFDGIKQVFYGIDPADQDREFEQEQKAIKSFMMVDEIRAKYDLKPLGDTFIKLYKIPEDKQEDVKRLGGMILDATFNQYAQSVLQGLAPQPDMGDMGGEDGGDMPEDSGQDEPAQADEGDNVYE